MVPARKSLWLSEVLRVAPGIMELVSLCLSLFFIAENTMSKTQQMPWFHLYQHNKCSDKSPCRGSKGLFGLQFQVHHFVKVKADPQAASQMRAEKE